MSDLYREHILDHYKYPRNYGTLNNPNAKGEDANPLCGDRMTFELSVAGNGNIAEVAFTATGCAISIASASLLSEYIKGRNKDEINNIHRGTIENLMEVKVGPGRLKCALLPLSALEKAIVGFGKI